MNKVLIIYTRLPGKEAPIHPAVESIVSISTGSRVNNIYSPGSDKLIEVQFYMPISCQPGTRVIPAFSDVKKSSFFSDLAVKAAKSENKKGFSTSEKARISSRVNKIY